MTHAPPCAALRRAKARARPTELTPPACACACAAAVRERGAPHALRVLKQIDVAELPPKERREAEREVDVLRSLQHPNVIGYHASFTSAAGTLK